MKKKNDFLVAKTAKLQQLNKDAVGAVDIITSTITKLNAIIADRQGTIDEIDDYCEHLMQVRNTLSTNNDHDAAMVANFSKLIEVQA